jgi:antitoxin Phd
MHAQWKLQEAKNHLSQVIDEACTSGPQIITVRGRAKAVILSAEEFERLARPSTTLSEFFRQSPLFGIELDLERSSDTGRDITL